MAGSSSSAVWTKADIEKAGRALPGEKLNRVSKTSTGPSKDVGQKPRALWVLKERLFVPIEFQRLVNERHVNSILENFDYSFLHSVHTGPEEEQGYPIIDGQHEWIAAMRHPDVDELLLTEAWWADTRAKQAEIFVKLNFNRINISPVGIHAARVTMGDKEALWMEEVLSEAGCKMSRVMTGNLPPLTTCAIGTLRDLRRYDKPLRKALDLMARAWPNQYGAFQRPMIEAVTKFVALHGTKTDFDRLRITLSKLGSADTVTMARRKAPEVETTASNLILDLLHNRYNDRLADQKKLFRHEAGMGLGDSE